MPMIWNATIDCGANWQTFILKNSELITIAKHGNSFLRADIGRLRFSSFFNIFKNNHDLLKIDTLFNSYNDKFAISSVYVSISTTKQTFKPHNQ